MSDIEEDVPDFVEVKVENEGNLLKVFLPENEHTLCDSIDSAVEDYSGVKVKKEFEYVDTDEPYSEGLKESETGYDNFQCKEEINGEELSEIPDKLVTQNQQNDYNDDQNFEETYDEHNDVDMEFSEHQENDLRIDNDNSNDSRGESADEDSNNEQPNCKPCCSITKYQCKFCTKTYSKKMFYENHLLKLHKKHIKDHNIDDFLVKNITTNLHKCDTNCVKNHNFNKPLPEEKSKIICEFCAKEFIKKRSLDDHLIKQHIKDISHSLQYFISSKIYHCDECEYVTTQKTSLIKHLSRTHNISDSDIPVESKPKNSGKKNEADAKSNEKNSNFKCQFCDKIFRAKCSRDDHLLKHHKDCISNNMDYYIKTKIHKCSMCEYETTFKTCLNAHLSTLHNEGELPKIECHFCEKTFLKKRTLDDHLLKRHKDKINNNKDGYITSRVHICESCCFKTTHKSILKFHMNNIHNNTKVYCQFCEKVFTKKRSLDDHLLKQHKLSNSDDLITSKVHSCTICIYGTTEKANLKRHIATAHNNATKSEFKCTFCKKVFDGKHTLDNHLLNMHKNSIKNNLNDFISSKIYRCKLCAFRTTHKSASIMHCRSHTDSNSEIKCRFCGKAFKNHYSLDDHLLRVHKDDIKDNTEDFVSGNIYNCSMCEYKTTRKHNLTVHSKSHETKDKMKCEFCSKPFTYKYSLQDHFLRHHQNEIKDNLESYITSKFNTCKTCGFQTVFPSSMKSHIKNNSGHQEENMDDNL